MNVGQVRFHIYLRQNSTLELWCIHYRFAIICMREGEGKKGRGGGKENWTRESCNASFCWSPGALMGPELGNKLALSSFRQVSFALTSDKREVSFFFCCHGHLVNWLILHFSMPPLSFVCFLIINWSEGNIHFLEISFFFFKVSLCPLPTEDNLRELSHLIKKNKA